jgi:hypothetical protein
MGAWGSGSFENDAALDFLVDVDDAPEGLGSEVAPGKIGMILGALAVVVHGSTDLADMPDGEDESDEYVESDDACYAIVAAEIIAAARGKPSPELHEGAEDDLSADTARWINKQGKREAELVGAQAQSLAKAAMTKIRDTGELRDLWVDTDDEGNDWIVAMNDLIARLG